MKKRLFCAICLLLLLTACGQDIKPTEVISTAPSENSLEIPSDLPTEASLELPSDISTETTTEPDETEMVVIRPDMKVDQEGVLQAELDEYLGIWPTQVNGISLYADGKGPNDFCLYKRSTGGDFILDRVGKRIIPEGHEYAWTIEGLKDPQLVVQLDVGSGQYYILDTDSVFFVAHYADPPRQEEYPLPDGLTEADVRDMVCWRNLDEEDDPEYLLLITDRAGNFYLDEQGQWQATEMGYHVARKGELWTVSCPGFCWELPLEAEEIEVHASHGWVTAHYLAVSYYNAENACIHLLVFGDELLTESIIDTSDWVMIPRRFWVGGKVMAPKEDGIYIYGLWHGTERLDVLPPVPDLSSLREEILAGRVVSLNDGAPAQLMDGFILDLFGNGLKKEIHVTRGLDVAGNEIFEFYVNGYRTGFSFYRKQYGSLEPVIYSVEWPDTGEFSKEAGYSLYLASLDGESISLFLSNEEQTYGLDFEEFYWDETHCHQGIVRIRGIGKRMEDFIPCQPLESYIQDGWLVRPRKGDRLDVTGDGEVDLLHVWHLNYIPFGEGIRVNEGEYREFYWEEERSNCGLGFPLLYYSPNDQGGYDLVGEITSKGQTVTRRFSLTDD